MAVTIPTPVDDEWDYVPIVGPDVTPGMRLACPWTVEGVVTSADYGVGVFGVEAENPDGTTDNGVVIHPPVPMSWPDSKWWHRFMTWRRVPKLADGQTFTATDGSRWVACFPHQHYPEARVVEPGEDDGKLRCLTAGSVYARGDRMSRGQLLTADDVGALWINDDPEWDWLPAEAEDILVGDNVRHVLGREGTVSYIHRDVTAEYTMTYFVRPQSGGSLAWYSVPAAQWWGLNTYVLFHMIPKPAVNAMFSAPDGSRWMYTPEGKYLCWDSSPEYPTGTLLYRGEITGGLTPLQPTVRSDMAFTVTVSGSVT